MPCPLNRYKIDYALFVHHFRDGQYSTSALGQQRVHNTTRENKQGAVCFGQTSILADTEVYPSKNQISSGVSKTTVTFERFSPHVSLRTSTTSESICNVKFLIICLRASECILQGYDGVASGLYVVSLGACDNVKYTE